MGADRGVHSALPREITSFVGRRVQIDQAVRLLQRARLVTLTGPGGVGKTRLAVRTARELAGSYAGGVVMVELAALSEPGLVARAVAEAFGLHDRLAEWTVADIVRRIGDGHALLLLDNCEHLVEACATVVDELLRATPHVSVLATSRQPLTVAGEHILPVPPLSTPADDTRSPVPSPDVAGQFEAVSLFVERATASTGSFTLDAASTADVVRLCQRLDGVPLAIELAAARLRALALPQLLARLDDRFTLLTSGPRPSTPRQRTLQSMVDWSFDLCTAAEQQAWSVLSVFEGGFDLEAAEHVGGGLLTAHEDGPWSMLDLVAGLVDKSVLFTEERSGQVRYRMLETIRAYGLDRLSASGSDAVVRSRHRDWFVGLTVQAATEWFGPGQLAWVRRLQADEANLRAAMQHSIDEGDPQAALRLAVSAWFYWLGWGSLEEGRRWLSRALAADPAGSDVALRVRAWRHLATLGAIHGDADAATQALVAARQEAAHAVGLRVRADGLRAAALAAAIAQDHDQCAELLAAVVDDPVVVADEPEATVFDLEVLGSVLTVLRRGDQALAAVRRGLRLCIEHDEDWHRGYLLYLHGTELWLQESHEAARAAGRESLAVAQTLDHTYGALCALELLAWIASSTDDPESAATLFGALAGLWRSIGAPPPGSGLIPLYHEACRVRLVDAMGVEPYERARALWCRHDPRRGGRVLPGRLCGTGGTVRADPGRAQWADPSRARDRRARRSGAHEPADRGQAGDLPTHRGGACAARAGQAGVPLARPRGSVDARAPSGAAARRWRA